MFRCLFWKLLQYPNYISFSFRDYDDEHTIGSRLWGWIFRRNRNSFDGSVAWRTWKIGFKPALLYVFLKHSCISS